MVNALLVVEGWAHSTDALVNQAVTELRSTQTVHSDIMDMSHTVSFKYCKIINFRPELIFGLLKFS